MTRDNAETPLFTKTYDFLAWLLPLTNNFPRSQRHVTTKRLLDAAYDFLEHCVEANNQRANARLRHLTIASAALDKVRLYLRLAEHWRWINQGQYAHASRLIAEIGRLLGGWQKVTRQQLESEVSG